MLDRKFADAFAAEWIAAWNAHDLDRVLAHYSDDFRMSSPYIAEFAGVASGTLAGKDAVRAYWAGALKKVPDLHFRLEATLLGVDSIVIYYHGVRGMAAEVFFFDADRKVVKASAHYA